MPFFKVQTVQRDKKVLVCANTLAALQEGAVKKVGLDSNALYHLFDDSDGTIIDDDECLSGMAEFAASKGSVLLVLIHSGYWSAPQGTPHITETADSSSRQPSEIPAVQVMETSSTPTTQENGSVLELHIPLRPFVSKLKQALKSPSHIRNQAITNGRRDVVRSLAEKLKRM